jgi:hypothetical protein
VHECLMKVASDLASRAEESSARHYCSLEKTGRWIEAPQQFLTGTLATAGALNAHTGRRHFTVSLELIESLVHASLRPGEEMPYEHFCERVLFDRLAMVVDPSSGAQVRLTDDIDHGELQPVADLTRLRERILGKAVIGAVALAASMGVTATYHLGYPDFRSDKLAKPLAGGVMWSAPTLLTLSPLGAPIAHAGLHVSAVVHSYETETFLPPHTTSGEGQP